MIKRSAYINLCLWLTLASTLAAVGLKYSQTSTIPGKESLSLLAPIFFVIAAKRASHSRAAGPLATVGLAFGLIAFFAVFGGAGG